MSKNRRAKRAEKCFPGSAVEQISHFHMAHSAIGRAVEHSGRLTNCDGRAVEQNALGRAPAAGVVQGLQVVRSPTLCGYKCIHQVRFLGLYPHSDLRSNKHPRTFQSKKTTIFSEQNNLGSFYNSFVRTFQQLNNTRASIRIAAEVLQEPAANPPSTF